MDPATKAILDGYTTTLSQTVSQGLAAAASAANAAKPTTKEKDTLSLSDLDVNKWYVFREHFETCVKVNSWDDNRAKDMLYLAMRDSAQTAVHHLQLSTFKTISDALDAYAKVFVNPASLELHLSNFEASARLPNEDLLVWHTRCRTLFRRAYPDVDLADLETDKRLKKHFCLRIRDRALSQALYGSESYAKWTYTECCTRAQNLYGTAVACMASYGKGVNHLANPEDVPSTSISALQQTQRSSLRCFYCNNPGHVVKECRKKARDNQTNRFPANSSGRGQPFRGSQRGSRGSRGSRGRGFRGRGRGFTSSSQSGPNRAPAQVASISSEPQEPSSTTTSSSPTPADPSVHALGNNFYAPLLDPDEGNE